MYSLLFFMEALHESFLYRASRVGFGTGPDPTEHEKRAI